MSLQVQKQSNQSSEAQHYQLEQTELNNVETKTQEMLWKSVGKRRPKSQVCRSLNSYRLLVLPVPPVYHHSLHVTVTELAK